MLKYLNKQRILKRIDNKEMKVHAKSHSHCQVARKVNRKSQNLSKSMSFANAPKEMKIVANLKEKYMEMVECQCLTKAIRNAGKVLNMKLIAKNKISSKLKINRFKNPHYA